jgi:hypothetical protein
MVVYIPRRAVNYVCDVVDDDGVYVLPHIYQYLRREFIAYVKTIADLSGTKALC